MQTSNKQNLFLDIPSCQLTVKKKKIIIYVFRRIGKIRIEEERPMINSYGIFQGDRIIIFF